MSDPRLLDARALLGAALDASEDGLGDARERYELLEPMGRGGMGIIYRTRDHATARDVALKMILPQHMHSPEAVSRFRGEIRAVASLDHPHILPIYDVGERDGLPFFTMKLCAASLSASLGRLRADRRAAVALMEQVARGVHHAHRHGILHRDLKPGNILLDEDGTPFVSDFGLAKWLGEASELTLSGVILGTPSYMAPEQFGRDPVTIAVDVYSLGAILYELLAGRPPAAGATVLETIRAAGLAESPRLREIEADIPPDLDVICAKALSAEPAERYASAEDFADDLAAWLAGRPIAARPQTTTQRIWSWARRNPLPASLVALVLGILIAATILLSIANLRFARENQRALAAEAAATERLWISLLAEARAARRTGLAGHRFEALAAVAEAARIRPSLELRSEAAAALALGDLRIESTHPIRSVGDARPLAFARDLQTAVRVAADGSVEHIRIADGQRVAELVPASADPPIALAPGSADGVVALRRASGRVQFWRDGSLVLDLPDQPARFPEPWLDAAFALDAHGKCAVGTADGAVRWLPLTSPDDSKVIPGVGAVAAVVFDPTGTRLAIVRKGGRAVELHDLRSEPTAPTRIEAPGPVAALTWSADATRLATGGGNGTIHVWDVVSGRRLTALEGHRQVVTQLVFNHAGTQLVSTAIDNSIRLWNAVAGAEEARLTGYGIEPVLRVAPDDRTLLATDFGTNAIRLSVVAPDVCVVAAPPAAGEAAQLTLDWSPDGRFVATSLQSGAAFFDAATGRSAGRLELDSATSLRFVPGGAAVLVCTRDDGLARRPILPGPEVTLGPPEWLDRAKGHLLGEFSPDGAVIATTHRRSGAIRLVPLASPHSPRVLGSLAGVWDLAFSPDGRWAIATGAGQAVSGQAGQTAVGPVVLALPGGERVTTLDLGLGGVAAFSPDGRWIAASGQRGCRIFRAPGWEAGPALPAAVAAEGTFLAWAPDSSLLALTLGDRVHLFAAPNFESVLVLDSPLRPTASPRLRFSPDGTQLALVSSDAGLHVWRLTALKRELQLRGLGW